MARFGFTTGSCSAAAAKAAAYMLLTGKDKTEITIETPKGILFPAKIENINKHETYVSCSVTKDGGDDPDITTGAHIYAKVSFVDDKYFENESNKIKAESKVIIEGGEGVGYVTKPGLDQPVGEAAINSVPRKMIIKEVSEIMELCDFKGTLVVRISVPEGVELAAKTFNPRLGIINGISILGTSGIVEPMSSEAILQTINTELRQKKALLYDYVPVSPGNYGLDFMKRTYDFDLDKSVKSSNFIGDTLDMAVKYQFKGLLLTGHIGKLVKIAGGMFNTHSKYGDCRMEIIAACAILSGANQSVARKILECVVTEDAVDVLMDAGIRDDVMNILLIKIMDQINKRTGDSIEIECMMYSNKHGMLAKTLGADSMLSKIQKITEA